MRTRAYYFPPRDCKKKDRIWLAGWLPGLAIAAGFNARFDPFPIRRRGKLAWKTMVWYNLYIVSLSLSLSLADTAKSWRAAGADELAEGEKK